MIDHIGFPVSDYARSKAFYESALAPLGYTLIMEVAAAHTESGSPAAGFGRQGKPDFWIGGEGGLKGVLHVAIAADDRRTVDAFYRAALAGPSHSSAVRGRTRSTHTFGSSGPFHHTSSVLFQNSAALARSCRTSARAVMDR